MVHQTFLLKAGEILIANLLIIMTKASNASQLARNNRKLYISRNETSPRQLILEL